MVGFFIIVTRGNVIDRTSIPGINYYVNTRQQQENIFIGIVMFVWFRYGWHYQYTIHTYRINQNTNHLLDV